MDPVKAKQDQAWIEVTHAVPELLSEVRERLHWCFHELKAPLTRDPHDLFEALGALQESLVSILAILYLSKGRVAQCTEDDDPHAS